MDQLSGFYFGNGDRFRERLIYHVRTVRNKVSVEVVPESDSQQLQDSIANGSHQYQFGILEATAEGFDDIIEAIDIEQQERKAAGQHVPSYFVLAPNLSSECITPTLQHCKDLGIPLLQTGKMGYLPSISLKSIIDSLHDSITR